MLFTKSRTVLKFLCYVPISLVLRYSLLYNYPTCMENSKAVIIVNDRLTLPSIVSAGGDNDD